MRKQLILSKIITIVLLLALTSCMIVQVGLTDFTVEADTTPFLAATDAGQLLDYLISDPNITVVGEPVTGGVFTAVSKFEQVNFGSIGDVEFSLPKGILVTTGNGLPPVSNTLTSFTQANSMPGDADVESFAGVANSLDAFYLQFEFTVPENYKAIQFRFMFGSDEYPEYLNTMVDGAAVIVDGVNYAYLPGDIPLKVVTEANLTDNTTGLLNIEYDGISPPQKMVALLDPERETHSIKIVIADTGDMSYDTGLFISNMTYSNAVSGGISEAVPEEYSVTYHDNTSDSGNVPIDANTYTTGATVAVAGNTGSLAKSGYSFAGWCTTADGNGTAYPADSTFTMGITDLDLYAKWAVNTYTISFDSNGGSAVDSISQNFASAITAPASPTREGYNFAGWFPALPANMPINGAAVSALWTRIHYDTETLDIQDVQGLNGAVNTDADVAAGFDVDVVLEVELLGNDAVPAGDKKFIEDKIAAEAPGVNVNLLFLDVSLFKITSSENGEVKESIHQANNLIRITFLVPEAFRGGTDYRIVRVHNGVTEYITAEYNPETHMVWFETDKFSTYALAYTKLVPIVIPVTGETAAGQQTLGIMLLAIAGMALLILFGVKRNKQHN